MRPLLRFDARVIACLALLGCTQAPVGEDTACTSADNGDGTYTLTCPDGTSVTLYGEGHDPELVYLHDTGDPVVLAPAVIRGDVYVGNDRELAALNGVQEIHGDLLIYLEHGGVDLSPLSSLRWVEGGLSLGEMPWLTSLQDLSSLQFVGGNLYITENPLLVDLTGLESLTSFSRLIIDDNAGLTSLDGLTVSVVVDADIELTNNPSLTDLSALSSLVTLDGDLELAWNEQLGSLHGLHNLTTVKGWAQFEGLGQLQSLDDLEELVSVGEDLDIQSNPLLTSVSGLSNLATVEGELSVRDNPALCTSEAQALADGIDNGPDSTDIANNDDC